MKAMPTVIVLLGALAAYGFGYARAVMHRANKDYKTTKAAVPVLRKGFWLAWWAAAKVGVWIAVAVAFLSFWAWHSAHTPGKAANTKPAPSASSRR